MPASPVRPHPGLETLIGSQEGGDKLCQDPNFKQYGNSVGKMQGEITEADDSFSAVGSDAFVARKRTDTKQ